MTVVIGLDLSLTESGLASNTGDYQTIGQDGITRLPLAERIKTVKHLRGDIVHWIGVRMPALVAIEMPTFSTSATGSVERHYLYLDVIDGLLSRRIPVVQIASSSRTRYAVGKGGASKTAVVDAVARRWPDYQTGGNHNLADAVVLCAMAADHLGVPLAPMPQSHRAALQAVTWPDLIGQ